MGQTSCHDQNNASLDISRTYNMVNQHLHHNLGDVTLLEHQLNKGEFAYVRQVKVQSNSQYEREMSFLKARHQIIHPNLIRLHGFTSKGNQSFCDSSLKILMLVEFVKKTLDDEINERRDQVIQGVRETIDEPWVWYILNELIQALATLQKNAIFHGNINPSTIFVTPDGIYKVAEYFLVQKGKTAYQYFISNNQNQYCYLSPKLLEQYKLGKQKPSHDAHKSDVWALGLTALNLATLTNCGAFYDWSSMSIQEFKLQQKLDDLKKIYSRKLVSFIKEMLIFDENLRPDFNELSYKISLYISDDFSYCPSTQSSQMFQERINPTTSSGKLEPKIEQDDSVNMSEWRDQSYRVDNPFLDSKIVSPIKKNNQEDDTIRIFKKKSSELITHVEDINFGLSGMENQPAVRRSSSEVYNKKSMENSIDQLQLSKIPLAEVNPSYFMNDSSFMQLKKSPEKSNRISDTPDFDQYVSPQLLENVSSNKDSSFFTLSKKDKAPKDCAIRAVYNSKQSNGFSSNAFQSEEVFSAVSPEIQRIIDDYKNHRVPLGVRYEYYESKNTASNDEKKIESIKDIAKTDSESHKVSSEQSQQSSQHLQQQSQNSQQSSAHQSLSQQQQSQLKNVSSKQNSNPFRAENQQEGLYSVSEKYADGSIYEGQKLRGQRHGRGRFFYADGGGMYDGDWKNGHMSGFGILYYPSGQKAYEGEWENDKFHGMGILTNEVPEVSNEKFDLTNFELIGNKWVRYEGNFNQNSKTGNGIIVLSNGDVFDGEFCQDEVTGTGSYQICNGATVNGEWKDNKLVQIFNKQFKKKT